VIPIRAPGLFAQAGVRLAILPYRRGVSLDGLGGRDLTALPLDAAFAVRGGMEQDAALAAITLEPARILRVSDRVGSLEPGKDADFLILNRHPLDYRACVEIAWINGKIYYERAKSPLFREIPVR
jgi:imidazolonepropionase-like amidohydrolase